MSDFDKTAHLARHEEVLSTLIKQTYIPAERIREAMLYSLFPAGKRIRPLLVYLTGYLIEAHLQNLDIIAVAIEMTHCYSLVHDDLPAMDDDDFRRGRPSCHRAFDEATAILVGDSMQALAIELLLTHLPKTLPMSMVVGITNVLVRASGPSGMVSGQSLDLSELSKGSISADALKHIHHLKTGKLITACTDMVLLSHPCEPHIIAALQTFSKHFGLVFQMQDDYLDKYGTQGKHRSSDEANSKTTFATLYPQAALLALIDDHYQQAHEALKPIGLKAQPLHTFLDGLHSACRV